MRDALMTTVVLAVMLLAGCAGMFGSRPTPATGLKTYLDEVEEGLLLSATVEMADTVWNTLPPEVKAGKLVIMPLEEVNNPFFEDVFISRWLAQNSYILERRRMPLLGLFFEKGDKKELLQKWLETEGSLSLGYEIKQPSQLASGDYILAYWDRGLRRYPGCLLTPLSMNQTYKGEFKVDYHLIDAKDGKVMKSLYLTTPAIYIKKEPGCLNAGLSPKGELILALFGLGILGGAGYYIKKNFID